MGIVQIVLVVFSNQQMLIVFSYIVYGFISILVDYMCIYWYFNCYVFIVFIGIIVVCVVLIVFCMERFFKMIIDKCVQVFVGFYLYVIIIIIVVVIWVVFWNIFFVVEVYVIIIVIICNDQN